MSVLVVRLYQARNLMGKDNGFADPFCIMRIGAQKARSSTVNRSLNPVWMQEFSFNLSDYNDDILLRIFSAQLGKDHFLGQLKFTMDDVDNIRNTTAQGAHFEQETPSSSPVQWFTLQKRSERSRVSGEIRVELSILEKDISRSLNPSPSVTSWSRGRISSRPSIRIPGYTFDIDSAIGSTRFNGPDETVGFSFGENNSSIGDDAASDSRIPNSPVDLSLRLNSSPGRLSRKGGLSPSGSTRSLFNVLRTGSSDLLCQDFFRKDVGVSPPVSPRLHSRSGKTLLLYVVSAKELRLKGCHNTKSFRVYCMFRIGRSKVRTSSVDWDNGSPIWNETLKLDVDNIDSEVTVSLCVKGSKELLASWICGSVRVPLNTFSLAEVSSSFDVSGNSSLPFLKLKKQAGCESAQDSAVSSKSSSIELQQPKSLILSRSQGDNIISSVGVVDICMQLIRSNYSSHDFLPDAVDSDVFMEFEPYDFPDDDFDSDDNDVYVNRNSRALSTIPNMHLPSPFSHLLIDCDYGMSMKRLKRLLFAPQSEFLSYLFSKLDYSGVVCNAWIDNQRTISYVVPATKMLRSSKGTEVQTLIRDELSWCIVESTLSVPDLPYGLFYVTKMQYCLWRSSIGSSHLRISACIDFVKETTMKSMISNTAKEKLSNNFNVFSNTLCLFEWCKERGLSKRIDNQFTSLLEIVRKFQPNWLILINMIVLIFIVSLSILLFRFSQILTQLDVLDSQLRAVQDSRSC